MSSTRILFVDDNATLRDTMSTALSRAGFDVTQAAGAMQALPLLCGQRFDMLVTDINLEAPLAGLEVLSHWRQRYPDHPVLFATDCQRWDVRARQLGPDDGHLLKPFQPAELVGLVTYIVRHHEQSTAPMSTSGSLSANTGRSSFMSAQGLARDTLPWVQ